MFDLQKHLPHLLELRKRVLRCIFVFFLVLLPALYFSAELYSFVATPLLRSLPHNGQLVATEITSAFTTPLKLSLFTSFSLIIPYLLYQLWGFITPALYPHEKKVMQPLCLISILLFYIGVLFAHWIILPMALHFFMRIAPKGVTMMTDIHHYLDFILSLYFAFGLAFQVPILSYLLIQSGITSIETLSRNRPYIIVAAFVIGMLLTPPDVISQILLTLPLLGLFESGLLLAKLRRTTPRLKQTACDPNYN